MSGDSMSKVTLKRIAETLGISITTVSRVLSGKARQYRISRKTESSIRKLAQELKFVPSQLARGLRLNRTTTIGLVIPDISNPYFAGIANKVTVEAHRNGYGVILSDSQGNIEMEIESIEMLRSRNVEGLLLCPVGQSGEHLEDYESDNYPLILVDRYFAGMSLPYVASDNLGGARDATNHLIDNGHKRIACLQGLCNTSTNDDRVKGYCAALSAHDIQFDPALVAGDSFSDQSGYVETKLLLKNHGKCTAILALSNLIALGALRAISEENRKVPDNISIISFDDQPYMAHLSPPMTTVAQENAEMGQIAVKMLFDRIRSSRVSTHGGILLPTHLVIRKSVRKLT
jgi:LacI family transcriptional regulator